MALNPKDVFSSLDDDKDGGLNLKELAKLIKDVKETEGFILDYEVGTDIRNELANAESVQIQTAIRS